MVIYLFVLQSFSHRCERSAKAHRRDSKTRLRVYRGVSSSAKRNEGNVGALRLRARHMQLYERTAVKAALQKIVA